MSKTEKFLLVVFIYTIVTCRATEAEIPNAIQWAIAIVAAILFITWP